MRHHVLRHRHLRHGWQVFIALLPLVTSLTTPASAQGFFDLLFGGGPSYQQQGPITRPNQSPATPGGKPYQFPSSKPDRSGDEQRLSTYGSYKTICVRMCDGYYFPISTSTNHRGFARDGARCEASCGSEGRLFHVSTSQSTIEDAVDDEGRSYAALRTAFLYRKKKVDGCQCRSAPWTEAEQSRHLAYAEAEKTETARRQPPSKIAEAAPGSTQPQPAAKAAKADGKPLPDAEKPFVTESDAKSLNQGTPHEAVAAASSPALPAAPRSRKHAAVAPIAPVHARSPRNHGPMPINLPAIQQAKVASQPKPQQAPSPLGNAPPLANPMSLGGGGLQWPGDAPPPQAYQAKRRAQQ